MEKHAYLIMAFNNFNQLKKLICLLDYKYNDIYVHVDAKSSDFNKDIFKGIAKYSQLTFIERIPVYWADYSQIQVTFNLLETARKFEKYKYYHLLSGLDLPIKTNREIHEFFDHRNDLFLGIVPSVSEYTIKHICYKYYFLKSTGYRNSKFLKLINKINVEIRHLFLKQKNNAEYYDGWTWFSITDDFAKYCLLQRENVEKIYKKSLASDEVVFQTLAYTSTFKNRLYDIYDLKNGSQRYIDWDRGKPYVFSLEDFDELINSNCMFARKFDEKKDSKIIDKIINYLSNEQKGENYE